jgi:hypothetical protein
MTHIFHKFDFKVLDDPSFKEDSVREELVAPLLHAVGYGSTGYYQIKRSLPLQHPFVSIGSVRRAIKIYPDYVLLAGGRPLWILDAKAPSEPVDDPDHLSQAYSYAVHGEVRVSWFAICNGRSWALYHVGDMGRVPRYRFDLQDVENNFDEIRHKLAPTTFGSDPPPLAAFDGASQIREVRTAAAPFDIDTEVAAFVPALLKNNPAIAKAYEPLTQEA